jgi:hypothetical protein
MASVDPVPFVKARFTVEIVEHDRVDCNVIELPANVLPISVENEKLDADKLAVRRVDTVASVVAKKSLLMLDALMEPSVTDGKRREEVASVQVITFFATRVDVAILDADNVLTVRLDTTVLSKRELET